MLHVLFMYYNFRVVRQEMIALLQDWKCWLTPHPVVKDDPPRHQLQLCDVADRVNLGLIPSSEDGWPVACRLLRRTTGGVLHIHQNITSPLRNTTASDAIQKVSGKKADREVWQAWADDTAKHIVSLLRDRTGTLWTASIQHIEHVKSYAPHVHHIVLDLECRPSWESNHHRYLIDTVALNKQKFLTKPYTSWFNHLSGCDKRTATFIYPEACTTKQD